MEILVASLSIHITGDPLPPGADGVRHGAGRHAGLLPDVLASRGQPQDRREVASVQVGC